MMEVRVKLLVPKHCSTLGCSMPYNIMLDSDLDSVSSDTACAVDYNINNEIHSHAIMLIYCRGDGVMWRGLWPLLFASRHTAVSVVSILLDEFQCFYENKNRNMADTLDTNVAVSKSNLNSDCTTRKNFDPVIKSASEKSKDSENSQSNACCKLSHYHGKTLRLYSRSFFSTSYGGKKHHNKRGNAYLIKQRIAENKPKHIINVRMMIFPPYPSPSTFRLNPERIFTSALVRYENFQLRHITLNAYISTLGGGYHLCRHLSTAIYLARSQRQIALVMGIVDLADRCTVNEAYNYIYAGQISHALKLIRLASITSEKRGDDLTVSMCKAAKIFAKRVGRAAIYIDSEQSTNNEKKSSHSSQLTRDNFQRIRIFRDYAKK